MKKYSFFIFWLLGFGVLAQSQNIDSLVKILGKQEGTDRVKTLIELCAEYHFTNPDTARFFGTEALNLSKKLKLKELESDALHALGVAHESQGNYNEALQFELKALEMRETIGNDSKIAATLNNLGIIYDEQGNYKESLDHYYKARKMYEKLHDRSKIAMVLTNIGIVLKAQGDYRIVVGYYQKAMAIYQELGKKFGEAACHANLGSVYFNLSKYDSALYYSLMAEKEFTEQNIKQFLPVTLVNAAVAFEKLGRKAEAKAYLLRAKKLDEIYDNKKDLAISLIHLARIYNGERDYTKAEQTATSSLNIATKINAQKEVMDAWLMLSDIHKSKKDFVSAYLTYKEHVSVKDSIFNEKKSQQLLDLQTKYETEKKEGEIKLLKQENEIKDLGLKQNRLFTLGLAAIVLALVIVGVLYQNRIKLTQRVELEATRASLRESQLRAVIGSQEEERKRFAADLHDGLGQIISAVRLSISKENVQQNTIDHALTLLSDMNAEIRNIAFNLMPQALMNEGLETALQQFAARINRAGTLQISVQAFDLSMQIGAENKVALYRICQEWVNNVIKYSDCSLITIQLIGHPSELVITIEDNGNGFDASSLLMSQGNGWKNINSRLALIKGVIEIDSQPNRKGSTAIITVPHFGLAV